MPAFTDLADLAAGLELNRCFFVIPRRSLWPSSPSSPALGAQLELGAALLAGLTDEWACLVDRLTPEQQRAHVLDDERGDRWLDRWKAAEVSEVGWRASQLRDAADERALEYAAAQLGSAIRRKDLRVQQTLVTLTGVSDTIVAARLALLAQAVVAKVRAVMPDARHQGRFDVELEDICKKAQRTLEHSRSLGAVQDLECRQMDILLHTAFDCEELLGFRPTCAELALEVDVPGSACRNDGSGAVQTCLNILQGMSVELSSVHPVEGERVRAEWTSMREAPRSLELEHDLAETILRVDARLNALVRSAARAHTDGLDLLEPRRASLVRLLHPSSSRSGTSPARSSSPPSAPFGCTPPWRLWTSCCGARPTTQLGGSTTMTSGTPLFRK